MRFGTSSAPGGATTTDEVRSYLQQIGRRVRQLETELIDVRKRAEEAEEKAKQSPGAIEADQFGALGGRVAEMLRLAQESGAEIRATADAEAEATLSAARVASDQMTTQAEQTLTAALQEAEETVARARNEAEALGVESRLEAETRLSNAESEADHLVTTATKEAEGRPLGGPQRGRVDADHGREGGQRAAPQGQQRPVGLQGPGRRAVELGRG